MKTCNQCGEELQVHYEYGMTRIDDEVQVVLTVCKNNKCPNYALLQVPVEDMTKESK